MQSKHRMIKIRELLCTERLRSRSEKHKILRQQLLEPRQMLDALPCGNAPGQVGHLTLSFLRDKPVVKKNRRMGMRRVLHQSQHVGLRRIRIEQAKIDRRPFRLELRYA